MINIDDFLKLKEEKNCLVLAHNYQRPEIQDVADYVGDSFELALRANQTTSDIILLCGVDFMAETAAILHPNKKVLIPDLRAKCPMANMLNSEIIQNYRRKYPKTPVALYINTTAESKAEADVIFTSSNGAKICSALDEDNILVGPDFNLASFIQKQLPHKKIIPIPANGYCYVHKVFRKSDLRFSKLKKPEILVHPEVDVELQNIADFVGSTNQMFHRPEYSESNEFLIGTEVSFLYRLKKTYPDKKFYTLNEDAFCKEMKMHTLSKAYKAIKSEKPIVNVPASIAIKAKKAIDRMLEIMKE